MRKRTAAAEATTDCKAMIAEVAYFKAERRGFAPGYEVADWLEAERELDTGGEPQPRKAAGKAKKAAARSKRASGKK